MAAAAGRSGGGGAAEADDGRVDGAFHSPAFLAAKIASLQETERESWDDFKKRQLAEAAAKAAVAEDEVRRRRRLPRSAADSLGRRASIIECSLRHRTRRRLTSAAFWTRTGRKEPRRSERQNARRARSATGGSGRASTGTRGRSTTRRERRERRASTRAGDGAAAAAAAGEDGAPAPPLLTARTRCGLAIGRMSEHEQPGVVNTK